MKKVCYCPGKKVLALSDNIFCCSDKYCHSCWVYDTEHLKRDSRRTVNPYHRPWDIARQPENKTMQDFALTMQSIARLTPEELLYCITGDVNRKGTT